MKLALAWALLLSHISFSLATIFTNVAVIGKTGIMHEIDRAGTNYGVLYILAPSETDAPSLTLTNKTEWIIVKQSKGETNVLAEEIKAQKEFVQTVNTCKDEDFPNGSPWTKINQVIGDSKTCFAFTPIMSGSWTGEVVMTQTKNQKKTPYRLLCEAQTDVMLIRFGGCEFKKTVEECYQCLTLQQFQAERNFQPLNDKMNLQPPTQQLRHQKQAVPQSEETLPVTEPTGAEADEHSRDPDFLDFSSFRPKNSEKLRRNEEEKQILKEVWAPVTSSKKLTRAVNWKSNHKSDNEKEKLRIDEMIETQQIQQQERKDQLKKDLESIKKGTASKKEGNRLKKKTKKG